MPKVVQRYQVFAAKTRRCKPRLIAKNVIGQRAAISKAKAYHESHPGHMVGVYRLKRVKSWGNR